METNLLDQVVNQTVTQDEPQVHVFFNGQSWDLAQSALDIGTLSSDNDIRSRVAESLNVPAAKLASFTVDRNNETQHISLRPQAVFG
jgi:hypothetical protein